MKAKQFLILVLALLLALSPAAHAAADLQAEMDSILAYAARGASLQDWVDDLSKNHVGGADNYILALWHMGAEPDVSGYVRAIPQARYHSPVSRQGGAMLMHVCGMDALIPDGVVDETIGNLGLMSYICGLNLLNAGLPSEKWTADSVVELLLERRLQDGGWAVSAKTADPDATAMCLQAMANYTGSIDLTDVKAEAVTLLSTLQSKNGGYSSYGVENPESSAQVILALTALDIDPLKDERFIKNGRSLLDAMLDFRLPSGGFAHVAGGGESDMAAMQVLLALSALQSGRALYEMPVRTVEAQADAFPGWKLWALVGIAAAALITSLLSLIKRRGRLKRVLGVLILAAIAAGAVLMINIESTDSYYSAHTGLQVDGYAHLTIRCDTVAGRSDDGSTPESGFILPRTKIGFSEGETVFDLLTRAAQTHKLQMEHDGLNKNMAYIRGINYLYEYDYGELSGWMYSVGGDFVSVGCGSHVVKDGDEIIWAYTTDLGEDLK